MSTQVKLPTTIIPKLGRQVTRLGFGAYRVSRGNTQHELALRQALGAGINIIDTASNFQNGSSEALIGDTVEDMVSKGELDRNTLTVVTKAGYLSAADIEGFDNTKDYVQINDKSFHAISPKVIESQIEKSLERLKTSKLDLFMINGPERMLMAKNRGYSATQLYKDMAETFKYLDSQVTSGVIGGYGVCSNTMALPSSVDHVSLTQVLEACSKPDNFVAIEAPFNIFEREVAIGHDNNKTVSDIAKEKGLYLMVNRPLTAIANGQIRVLVNHALGDGDTEGSHASERELMEKMSKSFEKVSTMESDMLSELPLEEGLAAKFVWGQVLSENLSRLSQNHFAAQHYLTQQVLPAVEKDIVVLENYVAEHEGDRSHVFDEWVKDYRESVRTLADNIVGYAYIDTLRKNSELDRILNALSPVLSQQNDQGLYSPLSVKTLRFLLAHEQVGTVFTGMRDPIYVQDALHGAQQSMDHPLGPQDVHEIWQCPIFV
ncbi:NADP-dependent oxidoreductase domain-containing protein [Phascolomyces articulosus]|uniref:NADP-dependent oxidoreductase domain-containing protein n=1 Tax=Phascolomyces articulosus TaxID=60185 RepID=A0AAD5KFP1_9FUNG|nr:NADP-dependent oxidoreductase domain-containing protein [Phascolomyces articulosus]